VGHFYTNFLVRETDKRKIAEFLRTQNRRAFVGPLGPGTTIVYDEESEGQYHDVITDLASRLSSHFQCAVVAFLNHDDDILHYWLLESGVHQDTYDSWPGCFDKNGSQTPIGGDSEILCKSFGLPALSPNVQEILHHKHPHEFVFEFQRHSALAKSLHMSEDFAILGYVDFKTERLSEESEKIRQEFIKI